MKKVLAQVVLGAIVLSSMSGCKVFGANSDLHSALIQFEQTTNYSSTFNYLVYNGGYRQEGQWMIERDDPYYWFENTEDFDQVFRDESGKTYQQYRRQDNYSDFTSDTVFNPKEMLFDVSDLDSSWFTVDSDNALLYNADDKDLATRFLLIIDENILDDLGEDFEYEFESFSIELNEDLTLKEVKYHISFDLSSGMKVTYQFDHFGTMDLKRPISIDYPNLVNQFISRVYRDPLWYSLTVTRDDQPHYDIILDENYFILHTASDDQIVHGFLGHFKSNFMALTYEGETITSFDAHAPFSFDPPGLIYKATVQDIYQVSQSPFRFRIHDRVAVEWLNNLQSSDIFGVTDMPLQIANMEIEWRGTGDEILVEFDRTDVSGTHHWKFLYDFDTPQELTAPFTRPNIPLDVLLKIYQLQPIQHLEMQASDHISKDVEYTMDLQGDLVQITGREWGNTPSILHFTPLPATEALLLEDDMISYHPTASPTETIIVSRDEFDFPLGMKDISQWNSEWFSPGNLSIHWIVKTSAYDSLLPLIGYDHVYSERPSTITYFAVAYDGSNFNVYLDARSETGEIIDYDVSYELPIIG